MLREHRILTGVVEDDRLMVLTDLVADGGFQVQLASCLKESRLLLMSERALAFLTSGTEYA